MELSGERRTELGKAARAAVPLASHAEWAPDAGRDPVALLEIQAAERVPELVPIRHGRMVVSPFTYFRGAALSMASDLDSTPTSGMAVQLCGDAHLANFGFFASPERHLFFDVNDFDETAPGPWEWDVKRLAASLEVAARDDDFSAKERARIVRRAVRSYRETMREFSIRPVLEVWYAHLDIDDLLPALRIAPRPRADAERLGVDRQGARARQPPGVREALSRPGRRAEDRPRPAADRADRRAADRRRSRCRCSAALDGIVQSYMATLRYDRRRLLEQYRVVDFARKVVGVGSVGTESWIALLADRDHESPLFLQIKEAQSSVLERFTTTSEFSNHGQRVVAGQRLIQAASDIFLGWNRATWDGAERDYYFRQLRDWKGSADIGGMTPAGMDLWGRMCGWTLARAHARTGDRIAIAAYLGKSDTFDRAIADFCVAYADQNERDHQSLAAAVASGRLEAVDVAAAPKDPSPSRPQIWWKAGTPGG